MFKRSVFILAVVSAIGTARKALASGASKRSPNEV